MPHLLVVRHAQTSPDPAVPSENWLLTPVGQQQAFALGGFLARAYRPVMLASSSQHKAVHTAQAISSAVHLPVNIVPGLEEHHRENVPFMDQQAFLSAVRSLLENP